MARKKVKLAWIANDSARRATFKKRRKGLMKKVSELSILCDVKACAIIYGPNEPHPEVWPSTPDVKRVLARFKSMPEMEQSKKMMNQEGFLRYRISKLQDQLRKQERENRELGANLLMQQGLAGRSLHDVAMEEVTNLAWVVEMKAKAVQERIEAVKKSMVLKPPKVGEGEGVVAPAAEEKTPFEAAMEIFQRQDFLVDFVNPYENMVCGGEEMVLPNYADINNNYNNSSSNSLWMDPFFPFN